MPKTQTARTETHPSHNPLYFINLHWYEETNRSFSVLLTTRLCATHREQQVATATKGKRKGEKTPLSTIKGCCSRKPEFFHPNMPIMEAIFRLLLSNENQPMTAEEISARLVELGLDNNWVRDGAAGVVRRLIEHDRVYGLSPAPESQPASGS